MVIVNFNPGQTAVKVLTGVWQRDYGQVLRITGLSLPTSVEVHFAKENATEAIPMDGTTVDGVTDVWIPDELLNGFEMWNYHIYAYIYLTDDTSGQTEYVVDMLVKTRAKPGTDNPSATEQSLFTETINAVNEAADRAEAAAKSAESANITVDSELNETSTNPIQNAVVTKKIGQLTEQIKDLPSGGEITDEQVSNAVNSWLDEHPEATTTVQDGSITEAKLADDVKDKIDKASKSGGGMTVSRYVGQLFDKSHFDGKPYIGWALGNTQYDKKDDTVNVLVNAADYHGDGSVTDLYLMKMNPYTLDYELSPIVKSGAVVNQSNTDVVFDSGSQGAYTYGFCIDSNGDYLFMPNYCNVVYLFRSSDKGTSWKVTTCEMPNINDYAFTGLMQTSTGRLIVSTHSAYFWYSDDDGATWTMCASPTAHTVGHEAEIVELKENTLIAVMRRKWSDTTTGDWQGDYVLAPAVVSYSYDNGLTWTNPVESKTITEMCSTGCAIAKLSNDKLELYATSRYPHGDANGVIYKHSATVDDALEDNWTSGKVVRYAKAIKGDDFGYPSCCVDSVGNTHIFYYDGDAAESGSTNYYYIQSYQDINNIPINADDYSLNSPCIPYSAKKIHELINAATAKLQAQIDKLIIQGGGTPETDGTLDGTAPVYDGLYEYVDFLDESQYDVDTYTYSGYYGKFDIVAEQNKPTEFNTLGMWQTGYQKKDISADLSLESGVTFELDLWAGEIPPNTRVAHVIAIGVNNNVYGIPGIRDSGVIEYKYVNTSSETSATKYSNETLDGYVYGSNAHRHIVLVVTASTITGYIEGAKVSEVLASDISDFASFVCDLSKFSINGSWGTTDNYAQCLRVYNRALSADEIKNNYQYQSAQRS